MVVPVSVDRLLVDQISHHPIGEIAASTDIDAALP